MFPLQPIVQSGVRSAIAQSFQRHAHLVTPPRIRVSFGEKVCHGLAMAVGVVATPVWIILHLDDYKHKR